VVSGIAHEIGNQLALVGYAEAIKSKVAHDPEVLEFAEALVSAQKRLASMVDEILDFVSHDRYTKAPPLEREPSQIAGVVDEALAILGYDRDVRERSIETDYRAAPLAALHRRKFMQVVINLVSNAVLATERGQTIRVELAVDAARDVAILTVVDRGAGMTPDVVARLGEPFFSTRGARGSGLGVGICKRIVEEHGGHLTFDSAVGRGTRAVVTIPLLQVPA
jgi:two-component system sensor histidine kinase HydH